MTHIKTDIRNAVVAALNGQTIAGSNVSANRSDKIPREITHSLSIVTPSERMLPRPNGKSSQNLDRRIQIVVIAYGRVASDVEPDDDADAFQAQIEKAIASDLTLGGTCLDIVPVTAEFEVGVGETEEYRLTIEFEAQATRSKLLNEF